MRRGRDDRLQERERVAEDRLTHAELAVDLQRGGREAGAAGGVAHLDLELLVGLRDAVE